MAPSHVDLSVLWVPIMPETSRLGEQMEEVGKEATESFGKGSTGLGDKIHESVSKSRDKIKDVFHRTGSDAGKSMSDAFKEETKAVESTAEDAGEKASHKFREKAKDLSKHLVDAVGPETKKMLGDRLEDTVGGALDGVLGANSKWGGKFARVLGEGALDGLKNKLGEVKGEAQKAETAVGDIEDGNKGKLSNLVGHFGKVQEAVRLTGVEVGDLPQPIQDVVNKTADVKTQAQGISDIFNGLPGKIGAAIGPLSILGSAMYALRDQEKAGLLDKTDANGNEDWWKFGAGTLGSWLEKQYNHFVHPGDSPKPSEKPSTPSDMLLGPGGSGDQASANFNAHGDPKRWGDTFGSSQDGYDLLNGSPLPAVSAPPPPDDGDSGGRRPSSGSSSGGSSGGSDKMPSSFIGGASSSYSSPSDLHAGGSRVANLYAVARSLEGTPYSQALRNDCSGMVSKLATAALGMPPSVQFSTVNEGDWLMSHGFKPGVGPAGSLQVGWYDHGGGNMGHTAATLPNGMNAESGGAHGNFLVGSGAAGANDPQFTQHAWLPMDGSGGGTKSPLGSQEDPLFVSAAEKGSGGGAGASGAGGGDSSPLAQQLGSGLLGGVAQSVGLDGSVFKTFSGASNPMDFGITKLGTGLLNWAGGMLPAMQGQHTPKQQPASPTYNVDQSFNITQHGVEGNGETPFKAAMNSSNRTAALAANMPGG